MGCLFKVESEGYYFAPRLINRPSIGVHGGILQLGVMFSIETVGKAVHELELRAKFEVRQVKVTSYAHLGKDIKMFQLKIIVALTTEIGHGQEPKSKIGTMVVIAWGCHNKAEIGGKICCFQVLALLSGVPIVEKLCVIVKYDMPITKIHGGS